MARHDMSHTPSTASDPSLSPRHSRSQSPCPSSPQPTRSNPCWMCSFCHTDVARDMNDFVIQNVSKMSVEVVAEQVQSHIADLRGSVEGASTQDIVRHIREHVVSPVVSMAIHARGLSSLAETLRGNLLETDPETGQMMVDVKNSELYLKTVAQLCGLYKSDNGRLLFGKVQ